jgi:hypothetical protein
VSSPAPFAFGPDPDHGPSSDAIALPRAAALALWTAAYLRGDVGPDDAAVATRGGGHRGRADGEDLFDWMTELRRLPGGRARLVLPVPGRIEGLVGPPTAISAALDAEQAIVVSRDGIVDHTLVPVAPAGPSAADGAPVVDVRWTRFPGVPGQHVAPAPSSGGAQEVFWRALHRTAADTVDLDLVPEEPVPAALLPGTWIGADLPRYLSTRTEDLLRVAGRTALLTHAELSSGPAHPATAGEPERTARRGA